MGHSEFNQIKTFPFLLKVMDFGNRKARLSILFMGSGLVPFSGLGNTEKRVEENNNRRIYFIKKMLSEIVIGEQFKE
jgi:hypothetical protein